MEKFYNAFLYNHKFADDVKNNSAKEYLGIIDALILNYKTIYPAGKKKVIAKTNMNDKVETYNSNKR